MQYKSKLCSLFSYLFIIVLSVGTTLLLSPHKEQNMIKNVVSTNTVYYPYYKTVAHIDAPSAWTLVSTNSIEDISYYITDTESLGFEQPQINDKVTLVSTTIGEISDITITGFSVKVNPSEIYPGLSGTPVYDKNGAVLGYISAYVGSGTIYCIWR